MNDHDLLQDLLSRVERLEETLRPSRAVAGGEEIISAVCEEFRVSDHDLMSPLRFRNILHARQIGMYLARRVTRASTSDIAKWFGRKNHATVLHACGKVRERMDNDEGLRRRVRRIEKDLTNG